MFLRSESSMKRGRGGKEGVEHCWKRFAIIGNGLQLLGKRHMAAVLGAQTQGETHRQNDTSLAGRPKDTNPYPGRDPYRGIHKGGWSPKAAAPLCGGGAKRLLYCVAFPIIGNRFQLLQIKSNNVPPVLFHRFPVSSISTVGKSPWPDWLLAAQLWSTALGKRSF